MWHNQIKCGDYFTWLLRCARASANKFDKNFTTAELCSWKHFLPIMYFIKCVYLTSSNASFSFSGKSAIFLKFIVFSCIFKTFSYVKALLKKFGPSPWFLKHSPSLLTIIVVIAIHGSVNECCLVKQTKMLILGHFCL